MRNSNESEGFRIHSRLDLKTPRFCKVVIKYTFNASLANDNNRKNAFRTAVEMWRVAWQQAGTCGLLFFLDNFRYSNIIKYIHHAYSTDTYIHLRDGNHF